MHVYLMSGGAGAGHFQGPVLVLREPAPPAPPARRRRPADRALRLATGTNIGSRSVRSLACATGNDRCRCRVMLPAGR
ncbi:hypothetical protein B5X24_HaOG204445 [Helicoverpa armigera]|uniref:Uncharacterized protein n=1 Tax=Helicoverpa armigera TaxID=29058 RepID=A0A2W1BV65_HELAM|nr:hypothetical protein B5X24_HaOG204445 [Helicoverpa armigera]